MGLCGSKGSFDPPILEPDLHKLGPIEEYDVIIIGGGSAGIAAAKEAITLDKKILLCDYVKPSPIGTTWGLGGTCTNVGCIPKKLMHYASLYGQIFHNSEFFGYSILNRPSDNKLGTTIQRAGFNWTKLIEEIQNHIHSLNWKNKVQLREGKIKYANKFVEFIDSYTIELIGDEQSSQREFARGKYFIIAAGGRPRYLNIPGGRKEDKLCISSDDIFSMPKPPGKVLIIGGGYIALECAGFLHGFGCDITVMVRSVVLREFDQEMAKKITNHLETLGIKFLMEFEPLEIKRIDTNTLEVKLNSKNDSEIIIEKFNTVFLAIGRDPCTIDMKINNAGVKLNEKNSKILVNLADQTNIKHICALGDIADGHMELTPIAIHSARRLIKRIFGLSKELTDYINVPTTIFTPIEYGCIGLSEEAAISKYGKSNVSVYAKSFLPLQFILPHQDPDACFAKLICVKNLKELVVGLHYFGPDAAEVVQGYQLGFHLKAKKSDFDNCIGVHPSCGELFTILKYSKDSGHSDDSKDC